MISGSGKTASTLLPRVHRVASLLKRWLLGTHQRAVSRDHLDYYLDEFTFRFNPGHRSVEESSSSGWWNRQYYRSHYLRATRH
ncbi:MAG: transposase [Chromatiales bacterium]